MARIPQRCGSHATKRTHQAPHLHQERPKVLRGFGRHCRGHGHVFVKLVRHTEHQLLELGKPITALGHQAQQRLAQATALSDATRQRWADAFNAAMSRHAHIRTQSTQLTHGTQLGHAKRVHAYDRTIAPIRTGKSHCPAQCGRKPGLASDPATGLLFANRGPAGNPYDASDVLPLRDKVHSALDRVSALPRLRVHAVAGDLGLNEAALRQALPARGLLTIGMPKTVEPINPTPTPEEMHAILAEAGFHRQRTPSHVQLACACGSRRPVVESHSASFRARGAGQVRYKGLQGAVVQQGMTVMAHNGATLVRIRPQRLSKRAQKFRRLLG